HFANAKNRKISVHWNRLVCGLFMALLTWFDSGFCIITRLSIRLTHSYIFPRLYLLYDLGTCANYITVITWQNYLPFSAPDLASLGTLSNKPDRPLRVNMASFT